MTHVAFRFQSSVGVAVFCGLLLCGGATHGSNLSNTGPLHEVCQPHLSSMPSNAGSWKPIGPTRYASDPEALLLGLGRINRLAFDPTDENVIYAGSSTGPLWRTADGGGSWTAISAALGVSGIAVDPMSPETIYLLSGDGDGLGVNSFYVMSSGVFKTENGGDTWRRQVLPIKDDYVGYDLVIHSDERETYLLAPTTAGLYRTKDGTLGEWTKVLGGKKEVFFDVELKPGDPSTVYAVSVERDGRHHSMVRFYRSGDGGKNWGKPQAEKRIPGLRVRAGLAVTEDEEETVYAIIGGSYGLFGFYQSKGSKVDFTQISNTPNILGADNWRLWGDTSSAEPWRTLALAANHENAQEVWAGAFNSWRSADGGKNWAGGTFWIRLPWYQGRTIQLDFHDLGFRGSTLYAANDGGVYRRKSDDEWENLSFGLNIARMYGICGDPEDAGSFYFGGHDTGTMRVDPKTQTATAIAYYDGMDCLVESGNPDLIFASAQQGRLFRSTDGGKSLVSMALPGTSGAARNPWMTPFTAYPGNVQRIFECLPSGIWQTMDGGRLWERISPQASGGACRDIAATASDSAGIYDVLKPPDPPAEKAAVYVATACGIFKGAEEHLDWEWHRIKLPGGFNCKSAGASVRSLAVNPLKPEEIWVTINGLEEGVKVFKGVPGFNFFKLEFVDWENMSEGLPNASANTLLFDEETGIVYLGMDCGLFYRDLRQPESLQKWMPFFKGLPWPNTTVQDLLIQRDRETGDRLLRAATFSQGAWESPVYMPSRGADGEGADK